MPCRRNEGGSFHTCARAAGFIKMSMSTSATSFCFKVNTGGRTILVDIAPTAERGPLRGTNKAIAPLRSVLPLVEQPI